MCALNCVFTLVVLLMVTMYTPVAARTRVVKLDKQYLPTSNVQSHFNLTNVDTTSATTDVETTETPGATETETETETSNNIDNKCDCVCGVPTRKQRIVGGVVTRVNELPWIAALSRRGKFYCGGALITSRHVLTAAHCIEGMDLKEIRVTLGDHDRLVTNESLSIERRIVDAKPHKEFKLVTFNNDVAVLTLDEAVELGTSIRTACLPEPTTRDYTGLNAIVAGWGRTTERGQTSSVLLKVAVPMISMDECRKSGYPASRITENMICAGYPQGKKDACQGDSGGPMHLDGEQGSLEVIGIVSWGRGCARPNYPGVYTRVSNYIDWIKDKLDDECLCPPLH